jgi:hypothetical protein
MGPLKQFHVSYWHIPSIRTSVASRAKATPVAVHPTIAREATPGRERGRCRWASNSATNRFQSEVIFRIAQGIYALI